MRGGGGSGITTHANVSSTSRDNHHEERGREIERDGGETAGKGGIEATMVDAGGGVRFRQLGTTLVTKVADASTPATGGRLVRRQQ